MQLSNTQPSTTLLIILRRISLLAGILVILIASLTLVGWFLQIERLRMPFLNMAVMKPNEALALISAGLALLLWRQAPQRTNPQRINRPWQKWLAQSLGSLTALLGLLTLGEYLSGWNLGIDELLLREQVLAPFSLFPGRMAFNTALCLTLSGCALLLMDWQTRWGHPSEWLTLLTGFIVLMAFSGYIYGVQEFVGPFDFSGMALHTIFAFAVLCWGILTVRPAQGMMAYFWSAGPQGIVARQMTFGGVGALLLLSCLTELGEHWGWYGRDFESALLLSLGSTILAILVYRSARVLTRLECARQRGLAALHEQHALLQGVINGAQDGIYVRDLAGHYLLVNRVGAALLDLTTEAMIGKRYQDLFSNQLAATIGTEDQAVLTSGKAHVQELESRQADTLHILHSIKSPYRSYDGEIVGVLNVVRDITDRKMIENQLRASQQALQQLNATLEQRVAERTTELERSNRELDQFAYVASHDLKAPLRAILNLASWLNEDAADQLPPSSQEHLQKLHRRAQRMERLLDDLLAYSRVGRRDGAAEMVQVESLLQDVIYLLAPPPDFQIQIGVMPTVYSSRTQLELIFRNLIGNAIKHHDGHSAGKVEVEAVCHEGLIEFSVRDNGPGIDPQYHERIFGMFQTLMPRDDVEGSGMGLAIVKKTVEHRGGQIKIESQLGQGTTFCFTWPKTAAGL